MDMTQWAFVPLPDEEQFAFVRCAYWDANQTLDEDPCDELLDALPPGFGEMSEAHYDYEDGYQVGLELLRSLGLREIPKPEDW